MRIKDPALIVIVMVLIAIVSWLTGWKQAQYFYTPQAVAHHMSPHDYLMDWLEDHPNASRNEETILDVQLEWYRKYGTPGELDFYKRIVEARKDEIKRAQKE